MTSEKFHIFKSQVWQQLPVAHAPYGPKPIGLPGLSALGCRFVAPPSPIYDGPLSAPSHHLPFFFAATADTLCHNPPLPLWSCVTVQMCDSPKHSNCLFDCLQSSITLGDSSGTHPSHGCYRPFGCISFVFCEFPKVRQWLIHRSPPMAGMWA